MAKYKQYTNDAEREHSVSKTIESKKPSGTESGLNKSSGSKTDSKSRDRNSDYSAVNGSTSSLIRSGSKTGGGGSFGRGGGGSGSRNVSPTVSNGASALAAAANTMAGRGSGSGGGYGYGQTVKVGSDGKAPKGLSVGTDVVTGGGTYRIMGINSDGTYQSQKINNVTTDTYSGVYANAPYGGAQGLNLWTPGGINGSDGKGGFAAYGTGDFQDAEGNKYSHLFWDLLTDGTIRDKRTGEIKTYYPGDDRSGAKSVFADVVKAYGENGDLVIFSSPEEIDFFNNAPVGTSKQMNGATYTKNSDGGVTVRTNGDRRIYKTTLPDGSWSQTDRDKTTERGSDGWSGGGGGFGDLTGGGFGGLTGTVPVGLTGGVPQQTAPAWQMPTTQGVQAFNFTPYENTARGQQSAAEYQALLDKIKNYPEFSYDPNVDPTYQQYADSYSRQGKLAMEDVLGQMAARTGGMASSFAEAAAQQQYDQYMARLADKIPELKQLAYSMYVDDYNRALGLYDRGYKRYSDDFDRYMDQTRLGYDIYNNNRNFAYNAYRDQVGDQQWQQQFDWSRYTNNRDYNADRADTQWSQNWQQTQFDYQKEQDAWNRQLQERQYLDSLKAELRDRVDRYGYMPTQQDAETYGLTALELASLQEQARHVRAADASKYYSGW